MWICRRVFNSIVFNTSIVIATSIVVSKVAFLVTSYVQGSILSQCILPASAVDMPKIYLDISR